MTYDNGPQTRSRTRQARPSDLELAPPPNKANIRTVSGPRTRSQSARLESAPTTPVATSFPTRRVSQRIRAAAQKLAENTAILQTPTRHVAAPLEGGSGNDPVDTDVDMVDASSGQDELEDGNNENASAGDHDMVDANSADIGLEDGISQPLSAGGVHHPVDPVEMEMEVDVASTTSSPLSSLSSSNRSSPLSSLSSSNRSSPLSSVPSQDGTYPSPSESWSGASGHTTPYPDVTGPSGLVQVHTPADTPIASLAPSPSPAPRTSPALTHSLVPTPSLVTTTGSVPTPAPSSSPAPTLYIPTPNQVPAPNYSSSPVPTPYIATPDISTPYVSTPETIPTPIPETIPAPKTIPPTPSPVSNEPISCAGDRTGDNAGGACFFITVQASYRYTPVGICFYCAAERGGEAYKDI